jgi:hypothetical protein
MKILACVLLLLSGTSARAQTGTLKGVATDESGGVIAGAKVTLTSSTGQSEKPTRTRKVSIRFQMYRSVTTRCRHLLRSLLCRSQRKSN